MESTSRGNRLHIGFFGRTNVGKSSLINKITNQQVSIVSEQEGTTTDVVYKPMELLPIGAVVLVDTAGLDDKTNLASKRIENTLKVVDKTDIVVLVCDNKGFDDTEKAFLRKIDNKNLLVIVTKNDVEKISDAKLSEIKKFTKNVVLTDFDDKNLIDKFKNQLEKIVPDYWLESKTITENLVKPKDTVVLVVPIDKEAPKGRLILPQVQTIRELLDKNAKTIVVKESELLETINDLKTPPALVITDSQAFKSVSEIVPENIPLTSFSILFANLKGDIFSFIKGAKALDTLKNNDKILFMESCTHHAVDDDIARVKIPKLIEKKTGKTFQYSYHVGCAVPDNIEDFSLIIHCGACMTNSKEVLSRINLAEKLNIPITNYGVIIAFCLDILDRATRPLVSKK